MTQSGIICAFLDRFLYNLNHCANTILTQVITTSKAVALRLTADRETLQAKFVDLAYVTIEGTDKTGAVIKHAEPEISVQVSGVGELIASGTANPISKESYVGDQRKAFQGRLLTVIRTTGEVVEICLQVQSDGFATVQNKLQVK
jgi:beta-galactosidase